jgi:hypothetical protein
MLLFLPVYDVRTQSRSRGWEPIQLVEFSTIKRGSTALLPPSCQSDSTTFTEPLKPSYASPAFSGLCTQSLSASRRAGVQEALIRNLITTLLTYVVRIF